MKVNTQSSSSRIERRHLGSNSSCHWNLPGRPRNWLNNRLVAIDATLTPPGGDFVVLLEFFMSFITSEIGRFHSKLGPFSTLVPKFELKEAESIAPSVKMTIFPPNFDTKSVKIGQIWSKWGPFQHWYQNSN